jgi:MYXO-CTERM domain-containing protein
MKNLVAAMTVLALAGAASADIVRGNSGPQIGAQTTTVRLSNNMLAQLAVSAPQNRGGELTAVVSINLLDARSSTDLGDAQGLFPALPNTVVAADFATLLGVAGSTVTVTALGWDLTLAAQGTSWLSEGTAFIDDNDEFDANAFTFAPLFGVDNGGVDTSASGGLIDLTDAGLSDLALNTGVMYLELFESFDDDEFAGFGFSGDAFGVDNYWNGSISFGVSFVPTPGAAALLGLGVVAAGRRRR